MHSVEFTEIYSIILLDKTFVKATFLEYIQFNGDIFEIAFPNIDGSLNFKCNFADFPPNAIL